MSPGSLDILNTGHIADHTPIHKTFMTDAAGSSHVLEVPVWFFAADVGTIFERRQLMIFVRFHPCDAYRTPLRRHGRHGRLPEACASASLSDS